MLLLVVNTYLDQTRDVCGRCLLPRQQRLEAVIDVGAIRKDTLG